MLRRSLVNKSLHKSVQTPGPTLHGWGRSVQKRRLEYETVESKYHKREFTKNWDVAGLETRSSDYIQIRTYFNFGSRMMIWLWNMTSYHWMALFAGCSVITALHEANQVYDHSIQRAAWW